VVAGVAVGLVMIGTGSLLLAGSLADATGAVLLGGGVLLAAFVFMVHGVILIGMKAEANINRTHHHLLDMLDVLRRLEPLAKTISQNTEISDAARSITHREREGEVLRQAIREEMYAGHWETAFHLVDEMERRFGFKNEARELRDEMAQIREMTIEEKIGEALRHIEKLMEEYRWERARAESERLMKLFPRHERVTNLPAELNRRREARKQELIEQWKASVQREEIDRGIELLTELDQYLTREEAQSLQDSARHVFKARLLNLGVQFGLAVSEGRWRDALEVGLHVRQEFPNSRMAQEVEAKLDVLRIRAGFTADAEVTQRRAAPS
jgi:hypothetical protein